MKRSTAVLLITLIVAGPLAAQSNARRNQISFEASPPYSGAVAYAHRMRNPDFLLGLGGGFAWELNDHSFDRRLWNVIHGEAFARYEPAPWFQGEVGISAASTSPGDDTSEQRGFFGLYLSTMVGYEIVFIGPQVRFGRLGSELGWIRNMAMRVALPTG